MAVYGNDRLSYAIVVRSLKGYSDWWCRAGRGNAVKTRRVEQAVVSWPLPKNYSSRSYESSLDGAASECKKLDRFFKALIGGKDIRRLDGVNCHRLSNSLASDAIYCVSNGTVNLSKHIILGMTVKSLTSSRKMINILNRLGHCCNYNTLEELETETTISSVNRSQICPPDIIQSPSLSTGVAFDNLYRYVDTLTGKDTLHDTVGIIYQNVSHDYDIELNSSSISGNIDIPLPPTKEDGLLMMKFQNYRRLIIDCKC
ncbi:hypothetical protein TNCV_4507591 [Trichonephila clavipes]|nr:hypothetical protein TNCV_4507591 [Trichonephila clavipes]